MNITEAYTLLQCSPSNSDEEIRKKFKTLAKNNHPDVNKAADAEEKFKKINAAYQTIEKARNNPEPEGFSFGGSIQDIFSHISGFGRHQNSVVRNRPNIELKEKLTFRESVLGTERTISYRKEAKCEGCTGTGIKKKKNDCINCGGTGMKISKNGNSIMTSSCQTCKGVGTAEDCNICNKKGFEEKDVEISINIPAGVQGGNTMQMAGAGHFIQHTMFGDQYSNTLIHLEVEKMEGLELENEDVVHRLSITLLEALKGAMKEVPTIDGFKLIEIPALSRHKEEVVLPKMGVQRLGNQRIILDISYPEDTKSLITTLEG